MVKKVFLSIILFVSSFFFIPNTVFATDDPALNTDFIDVSSWQGYLSKQDYLSMKDAGVKGVVVKVTEGLSYLNPYAESQISNAKQAGLITSVYHYSRYKSSFEANQEAHFFYKNAIKVGASSKNSVFVNDAEDNDLLRSSELMTNEARIFKETLKALGVKKTDVYTSEYWKNTYLNLSKIGDKGWIASYPFTPKKGMNWNSENHAWQWSGSFYFSGIYGKSFDVNIDYSGYYTGETVNIPEPEVIEKNDSSIVEYIVQSGDSLSLIGQKLGIDWRSIATINNLNAPYLIHPSQILKLQEKKNHVVTANETLSEISIRYNMSLDNILRLNPEITNADLIIVSQKIKIE
ncbi:GH25 family lysozyme [Enterococcus hulanensis]|uniref:GH25 family lysozyme n=1 Tax=Enterococcus hulanensis TaxID=2559929 RepID=UPI00288EEC90|nr:GH25 family lysozyme [Enterococcus hulanensis]MDT2660505.1 GH25 family lysozyme [Enterococcus hulanensis]